MGPNNYEEHQNEKGEKGKKRKRGRRPPFFNASRCALCHHYFNGQRRVNADRFAYVQLFNADCLSTLIFFEDYTLPRFFAYSLIFRIAEPDIHSIRISVIVNDYFVHALSEFFTTSIPAWKGSGGQVLNYLFSSLKGEEAVPNVPVIPCPSLFSPTVRTL